MSRFATWNVNSIKMRLEHLVNWMESAKIDAVAIQETKCVDEQFPVKELAEAGFDCVYCGQKSYNGVAIVTRKSTVKSVTDVVRNIPGLEDEQKRLICATIEMLDGTKVRFAGGYFPNGQEVGCDKYLYKLDWMANLCLWLKGEVAGHENFILGGDFNIAPTDDDLWNAEEKKDQVYVSHPERTSFQALLSCGLTDTWTIGLHAPGTYSWWDYRQNGYEANHGMRIDHLLASKSLAERITNVWVDTDPRELEKPSDHAPVILEF